MKTPKAFNNYEVLAFTPATSLGVEARYSGTKSTAAAVGFLTLSVPNNDPTGHTAQGFPHNLLPQQDGLHVRVETAVITTSGEIVPARQTAITESGEVVHQHWNAEKTHKYEGVYPTP